MRKFNPNEKALLRAIASIKTTDTISLKEFLEKIFFTEKKGRALILQTIDRYVVLYLKPDLFNDEKIKRREVALFFELIALLKYVHDERYVSFMSPDFQTQKPMYFIQDAFGNPSPEKGTEKIILNLKEDYTLDPKTIMNKEGKIIYSGILFDLESYHFLVRNLTGTMIVGEVLKNYVSRKFTTKSDRKQQKHNVFLWSFGIVNVLLFVFTFHTIFDQIIGHESYFNNIFTSNKETITHTNTSDSLLKENYTKMLSQTSMPDSTLIGQHDTKLYGIDISRYNGQIVKQLAFSDSLSFIICKATEGIHYKDPYFDSNWQSIKEKGYIRGAYHFFISNDDPVAQAVHYWNAIKDLGATDMMPIIDIEQQSLPSDGKIDPEELQKNLLEFLNYIENTSKRTPMIYTGKYFANKYLVNHELSRYPLWLAEYTNKAIPEIPVTWQETGFRIWQRSDSYSVHSEVSDFDVVYGSKTALYN